jgi:DMSO/TMAO reductase YedYZ molybdopterin-dependent catalytic subunit
VPLAALAERAGIPEPSAARVISLQERGVLREATLDGNKVLAEDALLALRVEGEDLSLDHGYPARIIVPALPGVHCTKWVTRLEFKGVRA